MRVFIAGPMTGYPDFNRAAFHDAEQVLRAAGHEVLNPARTILPPDAYWLDYMRHSIRQVTESDAVAALDGWQESRGARAEVALANAIGIPAPYLEIVKPIRRINGLVQSR